MGEGGYAYRIEYKTMTMTLLLLLLSLISLHRPHATSLTVTRSPSPVELFAVLGPWVHISLSSVSVVMLSFVGTGHLTAVVGGLCCCWAVCCSLSSVHVVVNWVVVVLWVAEFVCGGGCVMWQWATWRVHALLLTLVTWACGCRVSLSGGCHGLWVARDVHGGGCYQWVTWWQAVVEVVVVG